MVWFVEYKQLANICWMDHKFILIIFMFSIVLNDLNEQIELNRILVAQLEDHTHENEFNQYMRRSIWLITQSEELVGLKQYEDKIRNLEWQMSTYEDRLVEIQRRLSP